MEVLREIKADPELRNVLRDVRFRQALSYALNRKRINDVSYFGLGKERVPLPVIGEGGKAT